MNDWFFYQDQGQTLGPFTLEDLRGRIRSGQLKFHDLVYRDGEESWQIAVQHPAVRPEFQLDLNVGLEDRPWVCLHRKAEDTFDFVTVGPFSDEDIQDGLRSGTLNYGDYAWKHGMAEWIRIGSTERFNSRLKADFVAVAQAQATLSASAPLENEPQPMPNLSLRDVEELRYQTPTPPPLPNEAKGEDLTKQNELVHDFDPDRTRVHHASVGAATFSFNDAPTKPVPVTREDDWDRTRIMPAAAPPNPEPVAAPPSAPPLEPPLEPPPAAAPVRLSKLNLFDVRRARPWTDWTILGSVLCALIALYFVFHKHSARVAPVAPVSVAVAPTLVPRPVAAPERPRVAEPQLLKPLAPTQIQMKIEPSSNDAVHLTLHTDASLNFPLTLQVIGLPGQVTGGASSYQMRGLKATGTLGTPVTDTDLKLAPGRYVIRVEGGATRQELEYGHRLSEPQTPAAIARARKLNYAAIYQERLALYKTCLKLEVALSETRGARPPSTQGLEAVTALKSGDGARLIFFMDWWDMKELLDKALKAPSVADLERAHRLHQRISQFSVWGRVGAG